MERDRKCLAVTWRIENYNFRSERILESYCSPSFAIDSFKDTSWELEIFPQGGQNEHASFYVKMKGNGNSFKVDNKICFFGDDISSPLYEGHSHINANDKFSSTLHVPHHKIYTKKREKFLPPETLTICCKIYKSEEPFTDGGQCFIRTRIRVERTAFIGIADKLNSLVPGEKRTLSVKSYSTEKQLLTMNLSLSGNLFCKERVWVEIIPVKEDYIKFCKCQLFLLDSEGTKTACGRSEILFGSTPPQEWKFPLNFTKGYLMKKNAQFLSNDTLTLKCEFAFSTGIEYEGVEDSEIGNIAIDDRNQPRKFPSASEDMTRLYNEGILCDMKLQTKAETFNVHKSILSARSSVFQTMFTTDMREKTTDCVIIEDLEADTVRRMLMFFYSDKLEDLDWESAKSLYFAADKYDIAALKYRCSDFFKTNLQPSNSCDPLLLSHIHQDEDLKKAVQEYIAEHHGEIFQSDPWINLGKLYPCLTTETFQNFYLRNCTK